MTNTDNKPHTYHMTWDLSRFEVISHMVDGKGEMEVVFGAGESVMWVAKYRDAE